MRLENEGAFASEEVARVLSAVTGCKRWTSRRVLNVTDSGVRWQPPCRQPVTALWSVGVPGALENLWAAEVWPWNPADTVQERAACGFCGGGGFHMIVVSCWVCRGAGLMKMKALGVGGVVSWGLLGRARLLEIEALRRSAGYGAGFDVSGVVAESEWVRWAKTPDVGVDPTLHAALVQRNAVIRRNGAVFVPYWNVARLNVRDAVSSG